MAEAGETVVTVDQNPTKAPQPNEETNPLVGASENGQSGNRVLSFHNITYSVKVGKPFRKTDKTILRDVSGIFKPGLNAIMGPTGGGKTSLLDLLAKRKFVSPENFKGLILLNGKKLPRRFNLMSGYVVQDDVVMGTLTVRENIMLAANLRMKREGLNDKAKRVERVDKIVQELGLVKCQHTKVGTELIKGVSGGERKRCNIGMELVTEPAVLFLDEPTTGLDASTSNSVISLLRDLSMQGSGRIIVFSIHQPRFSIFRQVHTLHLLSCYGQTVYHGEAQKAVEYFSRYGLHCETYNNPPDFFLDIILDNTSTAQISDDTEAVGGSEEKLNVDNSSKKDLPAIFKHSPENESLLEKGRAITGKAAEASGEGFEEADYAANWFMQVCYLSDRSVKNLMRNPQVAIIPSIMMVFISLLVGSLYVNVTFDLSGFQNIFGALFFTTIQMMFGNVAAVEVFISGRNLFLHESANGYYRISSFFVAKIFADLLPLRGIPTIIFSVIFYLMVGLKSSALLLTYFVAVNLLTTMTACALAFLVSVVVGVFSVALAVMSVVFVTMVAFAGLIVNVASMPEALQVLKYVSIPRLCLSAHAIAQIKGEQFCGNRTFEIQPGMKVSKYMCDSGSELLELQSIELDDFSMYQNIWTLGVMALFFFSLTYIVLRMMPKNK